MNKDLWLCRHLAANDGAPGAQSAAPRPHAAPSPAPRTQGMPGDGWRQSAVKTAASLPEIEVWSDLQALTSTVVCNVGFFLKNVIS